MSLLDVRTEFVKQSGRYDLVVDATSFANNGADFHIKAGQRFLDRELGFPQEESELTLSLATNAITTTVAGLMTVLEVWVQDTGDNTITKLKRDSIAGLRTEYGDEKSSLANVDTGEPRAWALGWMRQGLTDSASDLGTKKLVTMPPADKSYTLIVRARLESSALTRDASVSFWTEEHPDVLVMASLYKLEAGYRNFEGSQAALANVREAVNGIYNEIIEQMQVDMSHLGDSHRFIEDVRHTNRLPSDSS